MSLINWTIYKFDIKSSVSVIGHLMDFLFISDISVIESSYLSHRNRFLNRTQIVIINKIKMAGEGDGTVEHLHWVLCNRCCVPMFPVKSPNPTKMMITRCRCIYCIKCSVMSTENGCISCGAPKTRVKLYPIG